MSLLALVLSVAPPSLADTGTLVPPPSVGARLEGALDLGASPAAALAVGGSVPLGERVSAEVEVIGGADALPSARLSGFGGVRVALGGGFSVSAAGGGGWRSKGPLPLGRAGVAYDLPLNRARLRVSALGEVAPAGLGVVLGVGVSLPFERHRVTTARAVPAPPTQPPQLPELPETDDPPVQVTPPDALVWVPHPVCAWVPADKAAALLAVADPTLPVQVRAPGYLPSELPRDGSRSVTLQPAPSFGAVLVVAYPGDRVSVDDTVFPLAPDGTAVFGAPEGPVHVTVTGAGRSVVLEGAVAAGYALWLRAPEPTPLVVGFPAGSAELPPGALPSIAAFADNVGTYGFRVVGSFSGEVDVGETRRLADARAEALKEALIAAGVPTKAINVISTSTPTPGVAPDELRSARVEPILPKEPR